MAARPKVAPAALAVVATLVGLSALTPAPVALAAGTPSAPRSVAAAPGNRQVTVTWRAPSSTGGAAINRYRVVYWRAGTTTKSTVKVGATARKLVVKSLRNGSRYYFQVAAHNRRGWGTASAKVSAIPRTLPGAPVNVRGTPTDGAIGLTWSAPASNGGATIGAYGLRVSDNGGQSWIPAVTDSGTDQVTTRSTTVHGLDDGSAYVHPYPLYLVLPYRIEVRAHNAAGWGPWSPARLAASAPVQMPAFVPGNVLGEASGAALRDWLTGSWWTDGYPTADGAGDWHEGPPLQYPVPSSCGSNPAWACSNGTPQDPPPSIVLDLAAQAGDTARRTVATVTGAKRYDLTYRGRVSTSEPIDVNISGSQCQLTIDSTQGTSPDLTITTQVDFVDVGWSTRPTAGNTSVIGLESVDYTLTGSFLCTSGGSFMPASTVQSQLASMFQDGLYDTFLETCGRDEPYYWQRCYPILDSPPPAPPAPAATPTCPAGTPYAGPYMTLSCNGSTLVRHCVTGWVDADGKISTGCEMRTAGVVPIQLDATTAPALADHLSGSFFLGGYPGGVGTGSWYAAPKPVSVALPTCLDSSVFGCPHTVQQRPMPTLTLDLGEYGDFLPRREAAYDENGGYARLTLRARMALTAPVSFLQDGVGCQVEVDTTNGAQPDVALSVAAFVNGDGTLSVVPFDDSNGWYTIQGLEDDDITIGPHRWCSYWAQGRPGEVRAWVRDTLVAWAQREAVLCGAPEPYYWQGCPAG